MCVNTSGLFIYTAFFKNILVIPVIRTCVGSLSANFPSMVSLPVFFSAFISLILEELKVLRSKEKDILKISLICFEKTVLNFHYFDTLHGNGFT